MNSLVDSSQRLKGKLSDFLEIPSWIQLALLLALQDRDTIYVHHIGVTIKWSISILLLLQVCSKQEWQIYFIFYFLFLYFLFIYFFPIKALLACEGLETLDFPRSRRYWRMHFCISYPAAWPLQPCLDDCPPTIHANLCMYIFFLWTN